VQTALSLLLSIATQLRSSRVQDVITSIQTYRALPAERDTAEYVLPPDVILVTVGDGSARLLDMSGDFHAVPAVGARMLQETLGLGAAAAVSRIAAHYGVAREQVQNDLPAFLSELESQGLLYSRGRGRCHRKSGLALARMLLQPCLLATHRLRSSDAKARILLVVARLSFSLFGWTQTVTAWQDVHARCAARPAGEPDAGTIQELDRALRAAAASHPVAVACKEQALCAWALARAAGLQAALVVGIDLFPIAGHCWCEVRGHPLSDDRERCDRFTPVARW
jgi:hypothetical protein